MSATLRVNDVELAYREWGSGGTPLVLLHGFTGSSLDWEDVAGDLARDQRVVTYDQRGHGDSTNVGTRAAYTFDKLLDDLVAVVEERGLAPFHLLGHSMGGVIAQRYAIEHGANLRSLILMDTAGAPAGQIPQKWIDNIVGRARREGMRAVADTFVSSAPQQDSAPRAEMVDRFHYKMANMDVEAFEAFADGLNTYPSQLEALAHLELPTTVIVGENDAGLRAGADTLAATIPKAELVVIPAAGHSPQEDDPTTWIAAVRAHLARA